MSEIVSSTARAWLVRPSYSVGSTPHTSRSRLVNRRTSWTVSSSWPTPRCDSVSHCSGISTPSRRGERRDGEHAERGRAVEQDPVVAVPSGLARSSSARLEHVLAAGAGQQVGLGAGQLDGGRQQVDAVVGRDDHLGRRPGPWSARGAPTARGPRGRCRGRTSGRPAGRGRRAAPTARARRAPPRARPPWSSWRRHPSGWRPRVSVVIDSPSCPTGLARSATPALLVDMSRSHDPAPRPPDRPRHRPHRRDRPRVRPPAGRARLRPGARGPRPGAAEDARRRPRHVVRRAASRCWPPTSTDRAALALVEARLGRPPPGRSTCWSTTPASGSSGGSSTTPSSRSRRCSTSSSPP